VYQLRVIQRGTGTLPTLDNSLSVGRAAVLETGLLPPQATTSLEQSAAQSQWNAPYVGCHTASSGDY